MKDIKKYLIGGIIGAVLFGSIGVYAGSLMNSNEVTFTPNNNKWNVTKVDEALNDLYSVMVPEEYSGITEITPTYSDITLNTQDKLLKNNITISGIPGTYKNLSSPTTGTSADLATGKTLYNSDGSLVTGTATLGGECVKGEFIGTSDCTTSTGCTIFEGFNPSIFMIKYTIGGVIYVNLYNASEDANNWFQFRSTMGYGGWPLSKSYKIENKKLINFGSSSSAVGITMFYIVCK